MIIELLLNPIFSIVNFLISLLPVLNTPLEMAGGILGLIEVISSVTFIIPVRTLMYAIAWWIALQNARFIMSIVNWVLGKIPTIN